MDGLWGPQQTGPADTRTGIAYPLRQVADESRYVLGAPVMERFGNDQGLCRALGHS